MSVDVSPSDPAESVPVSHGPTRIGGAIALVAGLVAVLLSAVSLLGLLMGVFGLIGLAAGLFVLGSRRLASLGVGIIFAGVIATGVMGTDEVTLVLGGLAAIVAFDATQNAFSVGHQLSLETETWRGEAVHAAGTVAVGVITAVFVFAIYLLSGGEFAPVALLFLLGGTVFLIWAIRA